MQYSLSIKRKGDGQKKGSRGQGPPATRREKKERKNSIKPKEKWVINKLLMLLRGHPVAQR